MNEEDYRKFLASDKRLFNRRGSNDSNDSSTSSSQSLKFELKLNPEAKEFIPAPIESSKPGDTPGDTLAGISGGTSGGTPLGTQGGRKSSKKNKKNRTPSHRCCQYCLRMGYDEAMYGSHCLRKKTKEIICPILVANL